MKKMILTLALAGSLFSGAVLAAPLFAPENTPDVIMAWDVGDLIEGGPWYESSIAHCSTQECYNGQNEESTAATSYCDTTPGITIVANDGTFVSTGLHPNGCVRYLRNRTDYIHPVSNAPWQIAQDDQGGKLSYVPNCLNGQPCMEGYDTDDEINDQSGTIENPPAYYVTTSILSGEFSAFALYKHVDHNTNLSCIFGHSLYCLGVTTDQKIYLRINGSTYTYGSAGLIDESWHLWELHRNSSGDISILIDGLDTGFSQNNTNGFAIGYWLSTFKGASNSIGRMESFYLYSRNLSNNERLNMRRWVYMRFGVGQPYTSNLTLKYKVVESEGFEPGEVLITPEYGEVQDCQNDCTRTMPFGLTLTLAYDPNDEGDYDLVGTTCADDLLMDGNKTCVLSLKLKTDNVSQPSLNNILLNRTVQ